MIDISELNKDQISLLLYMETCLVDERGKMKSARMNEADFMNMKSWKEAGFIDAGRLPGSEVFDLDNQAQVVSIRNTHWVRFTDEAWVLAHRLRRERAERYIDTIQTA